MDDAEFDLAVEVAREMRSVAMYVLQDPARSLANLARREFDGAVLPAWAREAEDPESRSKIAEEAVKQLDPSLAVKAPTRRGQHPERDAKRNIAALAAMWFLTERLGLKPPTRNATQKRIETPTACVEGGSVCDAVGFAFGWNYKNAERIWNRRAEIFRRHPLHVMTIWAELPSVELLGIPSLGIPPTRNK